MIPSIGHILKSMIERTLKDCSNRRAIYWINSNNHSNLHCQLIQVQVVCEKRKNYFRVHMKKIILNTIMISAVILNVNAMTAPITESPGWGSSSLDTSKSSPSKVWIRIAWSTRCLISYLRTRRFTKVFFRNSKPTWTSSVVNSPKLLQARTQSLS